MRSPCDEPSSSIPVGEIAALIPALDEEAALPGVLDSLREAGVTRVLVVDNGSVDRTASVAARHGARVVVEDERGYGSACLAGISALSNDNEPPRILVFLDADGSDDPAEIPRLVEPLLNDDADLAIGVRSSSASAVPVHARLGNRLVLGFTRLLHGVRFRDLGPFRAIRFPALLELEMDDRTWGWTLQMQLRAHRRGLRIAEIEVGHRSRTGGRSKISGSLEGSVRAGTKMLFTVVREWVLGTPSDPGRR